MHEIAPRCVRGAPAHRIKLPVREIDTHRADSGTWHILPRGPAWDAWTCPRQRRLNNVCRAPTSISAYDQQAIPDRCTRGIRMRHICVRAGRPGISKRVIDKSGVVGSGRRTEQSCAANLPGGQWAQKWIASADQIGLCPNRGGGRYIDANRHSRHLGPRVGKDIVTVMHIRKTGVTETPAI